MRRRDGNPPFPLVPIRGRGVGGEGAERVERRRRILETTSKQTPSSPETGARGGRQRQSCMTAQVTPPPAPNGKSLDAAAQVLERAAQAASNDPNVLYMLFLAYKRQGKLNEARGALRKI